MKELYTENGKWTISILDMDNYVIFDKSKPRRNLDKDTYRYWYFNSIASAIKELSRRVANEEGENLNGWLKEYKGCVKRVDEICDPRPV